VRRAVSERRRRPYTRAQVANQRVEATLRKQLVLAEDMGGPARPFSGYVPILASLLANYSNLLSSFFFFNVWVGSWQQAVVMVPCTYRVPDPLPQRLKHT
jgi:ABC-type long-subunit fatty acid transport system fused permease/ATPase subunit